MINVTKSDLPPLGEYVQYLNKIWDSRWLTNNGEFVQLFERELEEYLHTSYILPVANGTFALQVALKALNIQGEVITTPFTFAATTNAILWEGLTPVFADIDPETFNIDPEDVERKITDKTSAILAVHTYGNPCYVDKLQKIAEKYNLKLIYDAAHAFGVEYNNKSVLDNGDISTLSFHATKLFHTIEGGAIVAKKEEYFDKIKLLINHGIKSEEKVAVVGTNAKMNEFQAAMGICNLKFIEEKIKLRKSIYSYYTNQLSDTNIRFQKIIASRYNYSYMPICFENIKQRDKVYSALLVNNVKSRKYFYPLTVKSEYYEKENLVETYGLNNAFDISNRVLCLPIYPDLDRSIVDNIIGVIMQVISSNI